MTIRDAIDQLDVLCVLDAPSLRTAVDMAKDALREADKIGGLGRLRELVQADREGRCAVLPSVEYTEEDGENALTSAMNTCFYHNTPVTRYIADAVAEKLTREAAEKALEEMEANENE